MIKNDIFKKSPNLGQLAVNGEWERAVAFEPGRFCELEEARRYLGSRREVAFEAFFDDAFFGIRHTGESENLSQIIVNYSRAISSSGNGYEFFKIISQDSAICLAQKFKHAEIGAVNAWNSVGAFLIADPIASLSDFDEMWKNISLAPVSHNTTHRKAIEFAFDNGDGTTHWFAFPISTDAPPFEIEMDKLKNALEVYSSWANG